MRAMPEDTDHVLPLAGPAPPTEDAHAVAEQFAVQGMRVARHTGLLWCTLCTTMAARAAAAAAAAATAATTLATVAASSPSSTQESEQLLGRDAESASLPAQSHAVDERAFLSQLAIVGKTHRDVMAHCATLDHLRAYEVLQERGLSQWCRVELDGRRVLLDHHCVYPAAMYGPGRVLMNTTIAGGVLIATDVCGGVKLWPRHRYELVELVLPAAQSTATCDVAKGETLDKGVGASPFADDDSKSMGGPVLVHTISGRPEHLRAEAEKGRGGSGWARWRATGTAATPQKTKAGTAGNHANAVQTVPCCERTTVLPTFPHHDRNARGESVSAARLLHHVNVSIRGEATERVRRRRRLERDNFKGDGDVEDDKAGESQ